MIEFVCWQNIFMLAGVVLMFMSFGFFSVRVIKDIYNINCRILDMKHYHRKDMAAVAERVKALEDRDD